MNQNNSEQVEGLSDISVEKVEGAETLGDTQKLSEQQAEGFSETTENPSEQAEVTAESGENAPEPDTFPREYVEKLRKENADNRVKAKRVDELERRLHGALVAADGRLADPADLEFNAEHLEDADALRAAIGDLIERKPGLRARRYGGDVGAGKRGTPKVQPVDLIELMRGN